MKINTLIRFNAWSAVIFAALFVVIETAHNWGDWGDPAFWIVDYLTCLILFAGAFMILRSGHPGGPTVLAAGWGFASGMFWMAFFLIKAEITAEPAAIDPIVLQFALGLFIWTLIGLAISLISVAKDLR